MLGEVTETIYVVDEEDEAENVSTVKKQSEMLFVRGEWSKMMELLSMHMRWDLAKASRLTQASLLC